MKFQIGDLVKHWWIRPDLVGIVVRVKDYDSEVVLVSYGLKILRLSEENLKLVSR